MDYLDLVEKADKEREDMLAKSFAKRKEYSDKFNDMLKQDEQKENESLAKRRTEADKFYADIVGGLPTFLTNYSEAFSKLFAEAFNIENNPELQAGFAALASTVGQGFGQIITEYLSNATQTQIAALYAEIDNFSNAYNSPNAMISRGLS